MNQISSDVVEEYVHDSYEYWIRYDDVLEHFAEIF